jgi:hypothetical protein
MHFLISKFEGESGGGIKIFLFLFLQMIIIFDKTNENMITKTYSFLIINLIKKRKKRNYFLNNKFGGIPNACFLFLLI